MTFLLLRVGVVVGCGRTHAGYGRDAPTIFLRLLTMVEAKALHTSHPKTPDF